MPTQRDKIGPNENPNNSVGTLINFTYLSFKEQSNVFKEVLDKKKTQK